MDIFNFPLLLFIVFPLSAHVSKSLYFVQRTFIDSLRIDTLLNGDIFGVLCSCLVSHYFVCANKKNDEWNWIHSPFYFFFFLVCSFFCFMESIGRFQQFCVASEVLMKHALAHTYIYVCLVEFFHEITAIAFQYWLVVWRLPPPPLPPVLFCSPMRWLRWHFFSMPRKWQFPIPISLKISNKPSIKRIFSNFFCTWIVSERGRRTASLFSLPLNDFVGTKHLASDMRNVANN